MPSNEKRLHNFARDVYEVAKLIPKGRVTSYGAIAKYLGKGVTARMVGWAMHNCPRGVPGHRVVNSKGILTGKSHFSGPNTMQSLLEKEGHLVSGDRIVEFADIFWDPATELP